MFADNKSKINFKYIMTSYCIALTLISVIAIPVLLAKYKGEYVGDFGAIYYFIFSGVIFPFARIVYDIPIGFRLNHKIEYSNIGIVPGVDIGSIFFTYFIILLFSIILAPFGMLYLLIKGIHKHRKM